MCTAGTDRGWSGGHRTPPQKKKTHSPPLRSLSSRHPLFQQAFLARLGAADPANPDELGAWLVSTLDEVATDDAAASALLVALATALEGGGGPAATLVLDATAFEWGPPALRAGGAGPTAATAATALAAALAACLSSKEGVALLSGEVASSSNSTGLWAPHQAAALAALPAALARTAGLDPARRTRLLRSALDAASSGLGPALRPAVLLGGGAGGGGGYATPSAAAWWGALPGLASSDPAAARAAAAAVAADLGRTLLGVSLPLSPAARAALPRPAAAGMEGAAAEAAGHLLAGGRGGPTPPPPALAALAARAASLAAAAVCVLRVLGFDPAVAAVAACPFIDEGADHPPLSSPLDSEEEADAAATGAAAGVGWAIAMAACLCVDGCDDAGEAGPPAPPLARAAACVPALLSAASAARAPGAVALAAAAASVAAARTPPTPSIPSTTVLLSHLTAAMAGVPLAAARNAAFHAWDGVLGCLAPGDRVGAAVGAADAAAADESFGVEALAIHHLAAMAVAAASAGAGTGDSPTWRLASPALLSTCTARLTPGPPPLSWAGDVALAARAEPVAAALAGVRLLLLLGRRGEGTGGGRPHPPPPGLGASDLAALRSTSLLPLQASAARGAAALRAIGQKRGEGDQQHEGALALERIGEGVARVLELVEMKKK